MNPKAPPAEPRSTPKAPRSRARPEASILSRPHHRSIEATDPSLHAKVLAMLSLGAGTRSINRETGVTPAAIRAIRRRAEESGRLPILRERLVSLIAEVTEESWTQLLDNLHAGVIKPHVLPILSGLSLDKMRLMDDQATSIVQVRKEISPEAIRAAMDRMLASLPSAKPEPAGELPPPNPEGS